MMPSNLYIIWFNERKIWSNIVFDLTLFSNEKQDYTFFENLVNLVNLVSDQPAVNPLTQH